MAINVACPSCGRQYNVKDEAAGKRFKCKDCETVIEVPAAAGGDEFGTEDYGEPYGADPMADVGGAAAPPAPARRRKSGGSASAAAAAERTKLPAIFMYVICGMSIAYNIVSIAANLMGFQGDMPNFGGADPNDPAVKVGETIGFLMLFVFVARDCFLIYAFTRMHVVKSYGVAFAGAVIAVIPCLGSPCCALGMPFAIWALVVLNDPAVKSAFR